MIFLSARTLRALAVRSPEVEPFRHQIVVRHIHRRELQTLTCPELWQQLEGLTQTLFGDSKAQQGIFHVCARLIDSGGVRTVPRSLHADFKIAVTQLGDADDDKHRLTVVAPG